MPLSISNSNERIPAGPYGRQWLLAIFLLFLTVASGEYYLRSVGYRPSVKDTPELWAYYRNKCQTVDSSEMVIALGASRMESAFAPTVFLNKVDCSDVVMLPISGSNCLPVLKDLALNSEYRGVILCAIIEGYFSSKYLGAGLEVEYIDCYHEEYSGSSFTEFITTIDTLCNREIQSRLVSAKLDLERLIKAVIQPTPSYFYMTKERYRPADYRGRLSAEQLQQSRNHRLSRVEPRLNEPTRTVEELERVREEWIRDVRQVWHWAEIIENRGGHVIFIRFPTSGERWTLDQKLYPKELFWDFAAKQSPVEMIHFIDIPGADKFDCPDTSHLNYDDGEIFTAMIAEELIDKGILKPRNAHLP